MPEAIVVIPARWASTRFPGKVLAPLGGIPLVIRVAQRAAAAARVACVVVASDDDRVLETVRRAGFEARATSPHHASGTDRVAEAVSDRAEEIVIGLQADEPFVEPRDLDALVLACAEKGVPLATLAHPLVDARDFVDPNVVKVVTDAAGRALYFSRSPIPYPRPASGPLPFPPQVPDLGATRVHVGVYAWRREALVRFTAMPASPLERLEGLEQLRALEAGMTIRVLPASAPPFGVDTPEDLARAEVHLRARATSPSGNAAGPHPDRIRGES